MLPSGGCRLATRPFFSRVQLLHVSAAIAFLAAVTAVMGGRVELSLWCYWSSGPARPDRWMGGRVELSLWCYWSSGPAGPDTWMGGRVELSLSCYWSSGPARADTWMGAALQPAGFTGPHTRSCVTSDVGGGRITSVICECNVTPQLRSNQIYTQQWSNRK